MRNIRKNSISGVFESSEGLLDDVAVHFMEWWSGEGMDFTISVGKDERSVSLHMEEIRALVICAIAAGMVEVDDVQKAAEEMVDESERRAREIQKFREEWDKKWERGL